jgi:hypothetical protein
MCSGYYNYESGYTPDFPGAERFRGQIVHPQHWTEDVDYEGKRVVVIGSGATAVTLVPELAKKAATGLDLQLLGGMEVIVDGQRVDAAKTVSYKGMMFSDVPRTLPPRWASSELCPRHHESQLRSDRRRRDGVWASRSGNKPPIARGSDAVASHLPCEATATQQARTLGSQKIL